MFAESHPSPTFPEFPDLLNRLEFRTIVQGEARSCKPCTIGT